MTTFFTSDLHFGHRNVIKYVPRPFSSVEEMDATMIERWNALVAPGDDVYIVGDFALCRPARAVEIAHALNGNKFLVRGNHDKRVEGALHKCFAWVKDVYTAKVPDADAPGGVQRIVLYHYAMRVWDGSHYGAWSLYGHSHGNLADDPNSLSFDIGVDCWDYRPVSYAEVKARMATKRWKPVDHHGREDDE